MTHGTASGYSNAKCRCNACRKAWRDYIANLRTTKRDAGICLECSEPADDGFRLCRRHRRMNVQRMRTHYERKGRTLTKPGNVDEGGRRPETR